MGEIGDFAGRGGAAAGGEAGHVELPDGIGSGSCVAGGDGEVAGYDVEDVGAQLGDAEAAVGGGKGVGEGRRVGG